MAVTVVKVEANIPWLVAPAGSRWIAVCPPLQLSIEAMSQDDLSGMIDETLQLVFTDLLRENELDSFLREHGWTATNLHGINSTDDVEFALPPTSISKGSVGDFARVLA